MLTAIMLSLLCVSLSPEKLQQYADYKAVYKIERSNRAKAQLKEARTNLARARRSGGDISSHAQKVKEASQAQKEAARISGIPQLMSEPKVGDFGTLPTSMGKSQIRWKVREKRKDSLVIISQINAFVAPTNQFGERAGNFSAKDVEVGRPMVVRSTEDTNGYFVSNGRAYEVIELDNSMPVLEIFDAKLAEEMLAKEGAKK